MNKQFLIWLKSFLVRPERFPQLRTFGILSNFTTFELYLLNNMLYKRSFKAGEMLYDRDYPLEAVFFILKGEVEVISSTGGSRNKMVSANQVIGIIDMYHESIRSSSAKAKTAVNALAISKHDLEALIHHNPKLGIKFLDNTCRYLSAYIFELATDPVAEE